MSELQGLQLHNAAFAARNCEILAVVVDPVERNAKVVADLGLDFRILSDPDLQVIDRYDLRHAGAPGGDIARPASFLIDRSGIVRWRDITENYRIRPHPAVILGELDKLRSTPDQG